MFFVIVMFICVGVFIILQSQITSFPNIDMNFRDGADMVLIPAGNFTMGTSEKQFTTWLTNNCYKENEFITDELPEHKVYLDSFYIYKTEVTVSQYRKFCHETGWKMPETESEQNLSDYHPVVPRRLMSSGYREKTTWKLLDDHPIINITWYDARAYADWADADLPTEAQWEKAARGTDKRLYPWGNDWDATKLQCSIGKTCDAVKTAYVGKFPAGASPYGVLDMAGNVWEWCVDWYNPDYYQLSSFKNPKGPESGSSRVIRGGSWYQNSPDYFRTTFRYFNAPTNKYNTLGFRCVVNNIKE